ncbi:hypothetical protein LDENG_00121560 [Lucifuga dentata]|nr:hypothetical protein LDENG_00121560 [Lucifuga dentata]
MMNAGRRPPFSGTSPADGAVPLPWLSAELRHSTPVKKKNSGVPLEPSHTSEMDSMVRRWTMSISPTQRDTTCIPNKQLQEDALGSSATQRLRKELQLLMAELKERDRELKDMAAFHQKQLCVWEQDHQRMLILEQRCARLDEDLQKGNEVIKILIKHVESREKVQNAAQQQLHELGQKKKLRSPKCQDVEDKDVNEASGHMTTTGSLRSLETLLRESQSREKKLLRELQENKRRYKDSRNEITHLEEELQKSNEMFQVFTQRVESREKEAQKEQDVAQQQLHELEHKQQLFSQKCQDLEEKNQSLSSTVTALSSQVGSLRVREEELSSMLKLKDKDVSEDSGHMTNLTESLRGLETVLMENQSREKKLLRELEENKRRYKDAKNEITHLEEELQKSNEMFQVFTQRVESREKEAQKEQDVAQQQLHELEHKQQLFSQKCQDLEEKNQSLSSTVTALSSQVGSLRVREEELSSMLKLKDKDMSKDFGHVTNLTGSLEMLLTESQSQENKLLRELEENEQYYEDARNKITHLEEEKQQQETQSSSQRQEILRLKQQLQNLVLSGEADTWKDELLQLARTKQGHIKSELHRMRQRKFRAGLSDNDVDRSRRKAFTLPGHEQEFRVQTKRRHRFSTNVGEERIGRLIEDVGVFWTGGPLCLCSCSVRLHLPTNDLGVFLTPLEDRQSMTSVRIRTTRDPPRLYTGPLTTTSAINTIMKPHPHSRSLKLHPNPVRQPCGHIRRNRFLKNFVFYQIFSARRLMMTHRKSSA